MTAPRREQEVFICSNCGAEATRVVGAYPFSECGLSDVTLVGVDLITCDACKNVDPIIPDMNDLMRAIAWHIATQRFRLHGAQVRFLRKYLKMKAVDFAELLGVDNTTLSKWENDSDPIGPGSERLVRSLALTLGNGLKERSEEGVKTFTWITNQYYNGPVDVDMETLEIQTH